MIYNNYMEDNKKMTAYLQRKFKYLINLTSTLRKMFLGRALLGM